MIIAVASGKGGTGKTTIATSMALSLTGNGRKVTYLDCDVEAPNGYIFLRPAFDHSKTVALPIPEVNTDLCTNCGRCAEVCQFHAIVVLGGKTLVFPELCHGCGSCTLECPEGAISEVPRKIGILESGNTSEGAYFAHGVLNVGEPMAVPVIAQLKKWQDFSEEEIAIYDSPPGASCPVVETVKGADFVILVTEPTPFGLHDLKLAVQLTKELDIPAGIIINRDGIGDNNVEEYCRVAKLPVLMRVPFDRQIGQYLAQGKTLLDFDSEYKERFRGLYKRVSVLANQKGEKK
jgi:MinD superfamily P-loop ATPase